MERVILITGANNGIRLAMMTERAKNQKGKS
jgi:NAD(P)-dependent dehydrogenase (short-subunit alcohol dehydrogenase family)